MDTHFGLNILPDFKWTVNDFNRLQGELKEY